MGKYGRSNNYVGNHFYFIKFHEIMIEMYMKYR